MSLNTTIKSIQDIMRKDPGVSGDAQRIGQLGWLLFFKIFSDQERVVIAEDDDDTYTSPIPRGLRWRDWADENKLGKDAPTHDDLLALVDGKLFPQLKAIDPQKYTGLAHQRAKMLQGVFADAFNYMKSGTLLRQSINILNADIDFKKATTQHLFGDIYEQVLRDLQGAGNAGEFYTPRAVTQFAIDMLAPKPGERILDPACGTGGFLTCAYEAVKAQIKDNDAALVRLERDLIGVEKKPLPHVLCMTNLMVHGITWPEHVTHGNTLARPLRNYGPADEVDIVATNPPFGGKEEDGIETNFPVTFRTRETADLFLVLVMKRLKEGGRAAVVLPDGTLFGEGIKTRIKAKLLSECNLHTIVRLPKGVFAPYTSINTNILFFEKGKPTKDIWYYEHPYPEGYKSYSKTKPMRIEEFAAEKAWWHNRVENEHAWKVSAKDVLQKDPMGAVIACNLDIKNPNAPEDTHEDPELLLERYRKEEAVAAGLLEELCRQLSAALEGVA